MVEITDKEYRDLVETAPVGIYRTTLKGEVLLVNKALCDLLDYPSFEEFKKGGSVAKYKDPKAREGFIARLKEKGRVDGFETELLTRTGQVKNVIINSILENDITMGMIIDITERKRAEEEVKKGEEFFKGVIENASDVIIIVDRKGIVKYVSPSAERFLGYKQEEVIGRKGFDFIQPQDLPRAITDFAAAILTKGAVVPNSFRMRHKDGSERIFEGYGKNLFDNSAVAGFVMNVHDITERKRAEEELKENEARLKKAEVLGRIGNWEYDVNSKKIFWSDETYVLYGRDPALGPPTEEEEAKYYSADQAKILRDYAARSIQSGKEFKYDLEIQLPGIKKAFFSATMIPVKNESGKVVKLLGTVQDITERRRVENKLAFLARSAMDLVKKVSGEEIYQYIGERVREIAGDHIVTVSSFDEATQKFRVRAQLGLGGLADKIYEMVGSKVVGMELPIHDRARQVLTGGKLEVVPEGLYELTFHQIPEPVCKALEKLYNVGGSYAIGLTWGGRLYGGVIILARAGSPLENQDLIAAFINQAAVALQRLRAEEDLKQKMAEVEKANRFMLDRESRVVELKEEVNNLLKQLNQPAKYKI